MYINIRTLSTTQPMVCAYVHKIIKLIYCNVSYAIELCGDVKTCVKLEVKLIPK